MDAVKTEKEELLPRGDQDENDSLYTVNEGVNKIGFGFFQVLVTVFCGLMWAAEATELMLLSILSAAVMCEWDLLYLEEAAIATVVFFGFFLGGIFWGVVFGSLGKRNGFLIITSIMLVFGVLSALRVLSDDSMIPGYPWLLAYRFVVGFGAGGAMQALVFYMEFIPRRYRDVSIALLQLWVAAGSVFVAVLAIVVMSEGGLDWHWYLGFAATPLLLVLLVIPLVPESARFYLAKGKDDKAQKVMARIAWFNCTEVPPGRVVSTEEKLRSQILLNGVRNSDENGSSPNSGHANSSK